jgi:hypothetical protein
MSENFSPTAEDATVSSREVEGLRVHRTMETNGRNRQVEQRPTTAAVTAGAGIADIGAGKMTQG